MARSSLTLFCTHGGSDGLVALSFPHASAPNFTVSARRGALSNLHLASANGSPGSAGTARPFTLKRLRSGWSPSAP
eukprot:7256482-Lingulodinium_polyedra.AAC.1